MKSFKIISIFLLVILLISNFVFAQEESEEVIQIESEEFIEELEKMNIIQNGDFESEDLSPWEIVLINI